MSLTSAVTSIDAKYQSNYVFVIVVLTSYIYIRVYNGVLNKRSLRLRKYLESHNGLGLGRLQAGITQM
jgi:hypothetical protein